MLPLWCRLPSVFVYCFFVFFKSSSKLYLSHSQRDIFKESIYGYFWHLSQFVTVHYAKNLLILLYQTISWQEFKPVYSLLSPRWPLCIGSVPQGEDRPTVQGTEEAARDRLPSQAPRADSRWRSRGSTATLSAALSWLLLIELHLGITIHVASCGKQLLPFPSTIKLVRLVVYGHTNN